jgi:hypothetical protein
MSDFSRKLLVFLMLWAMPISMQSQSTTPTVTSPDMQTAPLERKLEMVSAALAVTNQQLEQSQKEILQLQEELSEIRKQLAVTQPLSTTSSSATNDVNNMEKSTVASIEDIHERQQALEAEVKLHEQTKIESGSKYPIRLTGLILFNSFINRGAVDELDLPEAALSQSNEVMNGSTGASFRQTILGIEGFGPKIAGARTSADVSLDFFAGLAYSSSATSAGIVRMRTASIDLDWDKDSLQFGMVAPLISPLSPTSYAAIAEPSMAGAGNLWTWSPQLRFAHQIPIESGGKLQLELGLWDPAAAGYSTNQLFRVPSPGEQSMQPAYESRISYTSSSEEHALQLGLGGYYSRQSYPYGDHIDSWAGTVDWRIPFGSRFEVSGEGYRGRALGGLGGGVYKDAIYGTNPITGADSYIGLNAIGGWTQLKSRFGQSFESNASIGLDDGFASDFHALILPVNATEAQLRARNKMVVGNLVFRPKTYLILSPEYRRIWTWPISGAVSSADIFTLSVGYQF